MAKQMREGYEIVAELGSGGMALVYKAVQKSLGRFVAIKELHKSLHGDPQQVQRFEREAKTSASFQHENIVHIYDYWPAPHYSIVMEFVDGTDLSQILDQGGPLPVSVGVMIALQACIALDYAHHAGFIHRDIKPGNIMVKRNGEVKLMDFGIAHTRHLQPLTLPGTFLGTPAYMSPDQILGLQLDARSDIFSLGIVLYEMFTGVKPFEDEDDHNLTARILESKFRAPRRINSDIPRRLQRIIKKCLKKKPQRRFTNMQELGRALGKLVRGKTDKAGSRKTIEAYLIQAGVFRAATGAATEVIPAARRSSRSRYTAAIIAVAVLLALATAYVAYHFRGRAERAETRASSPAPDVGIRSLGTSTTPAPGAEPAQSAPSSTAAPPAPTATP